MYLLVPFLPVLPRDTEFPLGKDFEAAVLKTVCIRKCSPQLFQSKGGDGKIGHDWCQLLSKLLITNFSQIPAPLHAVLHCTPVDLIQ